MASISNVEMRGPCRVLAWFSIPRGGHSCSRSFTRASRMSCGLSCRRNQSPLSRSGSATHDEPRISLWSAVSRHLGVSMVADRSDQRPIHRSRRRHAVNCYMCDSTGHVVEAVAICHHCGVALCREHLDEDLLSSRPQGHTRISCTHHLQGAAIARRQARPRAGAVPVIDRDRQFSGRENASRLRLRTGAPPGVLICRRIRTSQGAPVPTLSCRLEGFAVGHDRSRAVQRVSLR
jgi:hypothetical protein